MRAQVLSIGSELLAGSIVDTNAAFLAQELAALGIDLRRVTQVPDTMAEVTDVLRSAVEGAEVVVCTGGIGPTPDDLTREAVAELLGEEMTVDPELERTLRGYFAGRGVPMAEQNLKQATLIPSARALPNRSGTAPGWLVERPGTIIILLPGVPVEMKTIWAEEVVPLLEGRSGEYVVSKTLKTSGLGESLIAATLGPMLLQDDPVVATYAKRDGVHVVVSSRGPDRAACERRVLAAADAARDQLDGAIWGEDADTEPSIVTRLLAAQRLTVGTQELASAGRLARELFAMGSDTFAGGIVGPGDPPDADLALRIGPRYERQGERRTFPACAVTLIEWGREVESTEIYTPSAAALPERAAMSALDLLRRHLLARAASA